MGIYITKEMYPNEVILTNKKVTLLYQNACNEFKYSMYCCYKFIDSKENPKFIHVHDNDGSESDVCYGPFVVKWMAAISEKVNAIRFLPYLSYRVAHSLDPYLDKYLNRCLHTLNILPIELDNDWSGSTHSNEVVLRHAILQRK